MMKSWSVKSENDSTTKDSLQEKMIGGLCFMLIESMLLV